MKAVGRVELTSIELTEELQFVIVRQRGWTDYVAGPAMLAGLATWMALTGHELFSLIGVFVGGLSLFANWANGRVTKLRVTREALEARGNLGRMLTTEVIFPAPEVHSIGYEGGGEEAPDGLYVRTRLTGTCVLPGLSREQAATVVDAISRRFPEIRIQDEGPGSFLFGADSGITTLGLSAREEGDGGSNR